MPLLTKNACLWDESEFKQCKGFIEATDFERHCLWKEYHEKFSWHNHQGWLLNIATLNKRPISISVLFVAVDSELICFWEAISQLADYKLIDEWFKKYFPDIRHTNTGNAHIVIGSKLSRQ